MVYPREMTQSEVVVGGDDAALKHRAAEELTHFYGGQKRPGLFADDVVESATHLRAYVAYHWRTTPAELFLIDPLIAQTILLELDKAIAIPPDFVITADMPSDPAVIARIVSIMIGARDGEKNTRTSRENAIEKFSSANRKQFTDERDRWLPKMRHQYIDYLGHKINEPVFKVKIAEALEKKWNLNSVSSKESAQYLVRRDLVKFLKTRLQRDPDEPIDDETWEDNWTRQQLTNLDSALHDRREFVDLGMVRQSKQFLSFDWRRAQRSNADRIILACERIIEGKRVATDPLNGVDWYGSFDSIRSDLANVDLNAIANLLAKAHEGDVPRDVSAAIVSLRAEVESPKYRRCLLIQGSWGSGKTRLAREIAREMCSGGSVGLLSLTWNKVALATSIQDLLMSEFAELQGATSMPVRTMVDTLGRSPEKRVLVLIDDLHLWGVGKVGQLQELISFLTCSHQIQWIITADELRMSEVFASNLRMAFWPTYGVLESSLVLDAAAGAVPVVAGWVDLDEVNRRCETGFKILENNLSPEVKLELVQVRRALEQYGSAATTLMNPLPAWTRVEINPDNPSNWVLNLSTQEFVSEYWSLSLSEIVDNKELLEEIEWLITGVARDLIIPGDYDVPIGLLADLQSVVNRTHSLGYEKAREIAVLLESGGFARLYSKGDATVEKLEYYFVPEFDVLWGYRIARVLIHDIEQTYTSTGERASILFERLEQWGVKAAQGDWLAETVVQYGLGTLSWLEESGAMELWWLWTSHPDLSSVPLRIAGPVGPESAEEIVVHGIRASSNVTESKRELFLLLRFAAKSRLSNWTALDRLTVFSPLYSRINSEGFAHYFFHVLTSIFARDTLTSQDDLVGYMKALAGSEDAGFAAAAARSVTHLSAHLHRSEIQASVFAVMDFLRLSREEATAKLFPPPLSDESYVVSEVDITERVFVEGELYRFWEHLIQQFCRDAVRVRGFDAFFDFDKAGWFNSAMVSKDVFVRMRSEFNIAIGSHFRSCRKSKTRAGKFLEILTKLMDGSALNISPLHQRLLVFYMIRHTEVTHGGYDTRVDQNLRIFLRRLCEDRAVSDRLRDRLKIMAAANGIDC
jgi:hypothetical protein